MAEFQMEFHSKNCFFSKHQNEVILAIRWSLTCKCLNGSEEPSCLNDLFRHDNINGLNDQHPLWPQKNQKLLSLYTIRDIPGIRILSSLNDLNSLNNLSGLNDLESLNSSKQFLSLMVSSTLATKWPKPVSQCGMNH